MEQLVHTSKTKQSQLGDLLPKILLFFYGFVIGGCISADLLRRRILEAWAASTEANAVLYNLVDDTIAYYFVYGLMFLGLIAATVVLVWRRHRASWAHRDLAAEE